MVILVIGGTASGKSEFAENLTIKLGEDRIYIATMMPYDDECYKKIERHQEMRREKGFSTLEIPLNLKDAQVFKKDTVLLECMSNLLANNMYSQTVSKDPVAYITNGLEPLINNCKNLVVVSNQIFCDNINYNKEMLDYIKNLGEINMHLAKKADLVIEVVASIPIIHKGEAIYETL